MHTVNLLAKALTSKNSPSDDGKPWPEHLQAAGVCAITGDFGPGIPRGEVLGKSFTNLDLLRAPESRLVGRDAWTALTHKWERMSSWFCDGGTFLRLDRQGVRRLVLTGKYPPLWAGYATTSYKKHGALWAAVNSGSKAVWRFEQLDVDCSNHPRLLSVWTRINRALRAGVSRPVLETLDPTAFTFRAVGVNYWADLERWGRPLFRGALYQFLCYLLPSQEELKAEEGADNAI